MAKQAKDTLSILLLRGTDTLVIKKPINSSVFITSDDSIIINRMNLLLILQHLMEHDLVSAKIIQGILEELNTL